MVKIEIPGQSPRKIENVIFDVNGTLAVDGVILPGLKDLMSDLKDQVNIHLLTADTHGKQNEIDHQLGLSAVRIEPGNEALQKANYINELGKDRSAAIGQGANDAQMLKEAAIGICLISIEGTSVETLLSADIIVPDVFAAINLILNPTRLVASLRK